MANGVCICSLCVLLLPELNLTMMMIAKGRLLAFWGMVSLPLKFACVIDDEAYI